MVIAQSIAGDGFQARKSVIQHRGRDLHLSLALPAAQMMMIARGQFVDQVPAGEAAGPNEAVICEKLEGTVHRGFCQRWKHPAGPLVYLDRRNMPA